MSEQQSSYSVEVSAKKKPQTQVKVQINTIQESALFPVIHPDAISSKLDLVNQARVAGALEQPLSDQPNRSATREYDVDNEVQRIVTGYHKAATDRVGGLDMLLRDIESDTHAKVNETKALPDAFQQYIYETLQERKDKLKACGEHYFSVNDEFEAFRTENQLVRQPECKSKAHTVCACVFLLCIIVIEGLVNASFFSMNLESGLLGGFFMAALISALNVGLLSFIGAKMVRFINHRRRAWIGYFGLLIGICITVTIAMIAGHYRDALQIESDIGAEVRAMQSLIEHPLTLADIMSWLLFGITVFCGIAACMDGYWMDDVYPGYGAIGKKLKAARIDWEDAIADFKDSVKEEAENSRNKLKDLTGACTNGLNGFKRYLEEKKNTFVEYDNALRSAEKAYTTLIQLYRSENNKARKTRPPKYFFDEPHLDLTSLPEVKTTSTEEDRERLNQLDKAVTDLSGSTLEIRSQIDQILNGTDRSIETVIRGQE